MPARKRTDSPRPARRRDDPPLWSNFGLFAETLFTGVVVACLGVLVVTLLPAMAVGTSHLRRFLEGDVDSLADLLARFGVAWRALWPLAIGVPVLLAVLVVNAVLVGDGAVPGGGVIVFVMVALATALAVVSLRATAMWRPPVPDRRSDTQPLAAMTARSTVRQNWKMLVDAGRRSASDPAGSVLVMVAIGLCVMLGWMLLPLVAVAPGLLAFALVALEHRIDGVAEAD